MKGMEGKKLWEGTSPSWFVHPSPELLGSSQRPHLPGFKTSITMQHPMEWSMNRLQGTRCSDSEAQGCQSVEVKREQILGLS